MYVVFHLQLRIKPQMAEASEGEDMNFLRAELIK